MSRDYFINGETLVKVKGRANSQLQNVQELGIASESIRISPKYYHVDKYADDFGPNVPVEVFTNLAEVYIQMSLIHFDAAILRACVQESMGGIVAEMADGTAGDGVLPAAGTPLGGGKPLFFAGNHYIRVSISSMQGGLPWRFWACYLADRPLEYPIGTEKTIAILNWRCIPYSIGKANSSGIQTAGELISAGTFLWDHTSD